MTLPHIEENAVFPTYDMISSVPEVVGGNTWLEFRPGDSCGGGDVVAIQMPIAKFVRSGRQALKIARMKR